MFFERPALAVAPEILGGVLAHGTPEGIVALRITEVEAYMGEIDPGSHAYRGETKRNRTMFGPPGHLYVYFSYGMHSCANMVCSPEGTASGVLLRAGEIVEGQEQAQSRRPTAKQNRDLARGPARLTLAMGIALTDDGASLFQEPFSFEPPAVQHEIMSGPRTGVSGPGGSTAYPWRFWLRDDPTVSPYRPHIARSPVLPRLGF